MDFVKIIFPSEKPLFQRGKRKSGLFVSDLLSMYYHLTSRLFSSDGNRNKINSFFDMRKLY